MKKIWVPAFVFLIVVFPHGGSYAYNETLSHKTLSRKAAESSWLDDYLKNNMVFPEGRLKTLSNGKNIVRSLEDGSQSEDEPMCRASNHFHNPLNSIPWGSSFLIDDPWYVNVACSATAWWNTYSAITWATGYLNPSPGGAKISYPTLGWSNHYDWDHARGAFFTALTADTQAKRNAAYATTFTGLGYVLHMLQDVSVPPHVRSDFRSHLAPFSGVFGNPYEAYVKNQDRMIGTRSPVYPFPAVRPLTAFWDTNLYSAGCDDTTGRRSGTDLGLAEYTNANYLSEHTMFTENATLCGTQYAFPHQPINGIAAAVESEHADRDVWSRPLRYS